MEPRHAEGPRKKVEGGVLPGELTATACNHKLADPVCVQLQAEGLVGVSSRVDERNVTCLQAPSGNWGKKGLGLRGIQRL